MFNKIISFFLRKRGEITLKIFGIEFVISRNNHLWIKGVNGLVLDYQIGLLGTNHGCQNFDTLETYLRAKVDAYHQYENAFFSSPEIKVLLDGQYVEVDSSSLSITGELELSIDSKTNLISYTHRKISKKQISYHQLPIYL